MTTEQQRIVIAEACGWTFNPPPYNKPPFSAEFKAEALLCWIRPGNMSHQLEAPPDYLTDLNAMHEAEKTLTQEQLGLYRRLLYLVVLEDPINASNEPAWATAEQRAEAFLRTLNLWIE